MNSEEVFIRADLDQTSGVMTYFRLNKELRDFLQLLLDKGHKIEGVVLDLNDEAPGRVGWNIGFAITEVKNEPGTDNHKS